MKTRAAIARLYAARRGAISIYGHDVARERGAHETYVLYEVYITPGLMAMIQLFNGMQSSLTIVYDRETGGVRTLLVSPFPRWFLLPSKLLAGTLVSILQVYADLAIA